MKRDNNKFYSIAILFLFIVILIAIRIYETNSRKYLFLIWNIFLAWVPYQISIILNKSKNELSKKSIFLCSFIWLIFFPNSLYLVTDIIHLLSDTSIPKWFDMILLFSNAILGLFLGFISMLNIEKLLRNFYSSKITNFTVFLLFFMSSFGVYLGRFLRWNSWDIFINPIKLIASIFDRIIYPLSYIGTWEITIVFTLFFYILYIISIGNIQLKIIKNNS